MFSRRSLLAGMGATSMVGCVSPTSPDRPESGGVVEILDPELTRLIDPDSRFETLGTGYQWSEGPTWDRVRKALYFTDVPQNKAYRWQAGQAVQVFLDPSGAPDVDGFREPGANGLWCTSNGTLLICNHEFASGLDHGKLSGPYGGLDLMFDPGVITVTGSAAESWLAACMLARFAPISPNQIRVCVVAHETGDQGAIIARPEIKRVHD